MRLKMFATAAFAVMHSHILAAEPRPQLDSADVARWRADLVFLKAEMPRHHANLFHAMTRAQFDSAIASIDSRLPTLSRPAVIVELQKLAALIGDGHSNVGPWRDSLIAFHSLPVSFYLFQEGLTIRAADSAHSSLIGAKVLEIGGLPVDSAIARIRPLISHDNEMGVKAYTPFLLAMPEVLSAVGIAPDMSRVRLVVSKNGKTQTATVGLAGLYPMLIGDPDKSWNARAGWVDARDGVSPLWLSDTGNLYWNRYLADKKSMYVQINTIQQKSGDSLAAFMRRSIAQADSAGAERLILDLRLNGGGNGDYNKQIMLPIIKSRYDVPGRFYVLTSRRTFSAAEMLVTELQKYSTAIFVGESMSGKANHFGDSYKIVMPNSGITFRVSTLWHQYRDSRDTREIIAPEIPVALTFADYAAGRDAVLAAAISAPMPN